MARVTDNFTDSSLISSNTGGEVTGGCYQSKEVANSVCLYFDGTTNAYIDCQSVGAFNHLRLQTAYSAMACWFKPEVDATSTWMTLIDKSTGSGSASGYGVFIRMTGDSWEVRVYINGSLSSQSKLAVVRAGQWQHIAVVGDFVQTDTIVYINGHKIWQGGSVFGGVNATADFFIGRQATVTTLPFKGWMRDVRVYDEHLMEKHIGQLVMGEDSDLSSALVGHWLLDEGTGSTVSNLGSAGSGNDGTLGSGVSWVTDEEFYTQRARLISTNLLSSVNSSNVQNFRYQIKSKSGNREYRANFSNDNFSTSEVNADGQRVANEDGYWFDGVNDQLNNSSASPVSALPVTMAAWFKTDGYSRNGATGIRTIFAIGDTSSATDMIGLGVDASFRPCLATADNVYLYPPTTESIGLDGRWTHIVGVFNSSTDRELYINGRLWASSTTSQTNTISNYNRVAIGTTANNVSQNYYVEVVGDCRIWSTGLSASDVAALYLTGTDNNQGSLEAAYELNGNGTDATGNGHNLSVSGAVATRNDWQNMMPIGQALVGQNGVNIKRFDGVDDYVTNASFDVDGNSSLSAFLWFRAWKRKTSDEVMLSIPEDVSGTSGFSITIGSGSVSNDRVRFTTNTTTTGVDHLDWEGSTTSGQYSLRHVMDGKWHHVACVLDAGTKTIYMDGVPVISNSVVGTLQCAASEIWAGVFSSTSGTYYLGDLCNIAVWDDARTASEVETSYRQGYEDPTGDCLLYWTFHETSTTCTDQTGNGYTGTVNGTEDWNQPTRPLPLAETAETVLDITQANFTDTFYYKLHDHSTDGIVQNLACMEKVAVDYIDEDETTLTGWLWGWM